MRWQEQAACQGRNTNLWFPTTPGVTPATLEAIRVCRSCPVQPQCLDHAINFPEVWGVWGGVTQDRRRHMHAKGAR